MQWNPGRVALAPQPGFRFAASGLRWLTACEKRRGNTMKLIKQAFVVCVLMLGCSAANAGENCARVDAQHAALSAEDLRKLEAEGFAYVKTMSRALPNVVISDKLIASCRDRYIAERYFQNKIDGRKRFPLSSEEIAQARPDIARAVYYALRAQGVWEDGVSHEIFNTVTDALLPDWVHWQQEQLRQGYISEEYFTNKMFLAPDPSLLPLLNKVLKATDSLPQIALIYFLKKNLGEDFQLADVRHDLDRGTIVGGNISKATAIGHAMKILSRPGKVTWDEARQFSSAIYGWV